MNSLENWLFTNYGIQGKAKLLAGEEDNNYKIECTSGKKYLLKIHHSKTSLEWINFQESLLIRASSLHLPFQINKLVPDKQGNSVNKFEDQFARLLTWVEGEPLGSKKPHTLELCNSIGNGLGLLTQGLQFFEHPEAHRNFKWDIAGFKHWDLESFEIIHPHISFFKEKLNLLNTSSFRRGIVYNDANDYNILVKTNPEGLKFSGLIDFGDAVFTDIINDVAIACTYLMLKKKNPLIYAAEIVKGYHAAYPLLEEEVEELHTLIGARLSMSILISDENARLFPENEYLQISSKDAKDLIEYWKNTPSEWVTSIFRNACNYEPFKKRLRFNKWLNTSNPTFNHLISIDKFASIDLSVAGKDSGHFLDYTEDSRFRNHILDLYKEKQANLLVGGYLETRPFYTTDTYKTNGDEGAEWRTVHLGLDLWCVHGTEIYCPLDGEVVFIQKNEGNRNYGATLILKHQPEEGLEFFTLYGHLSESSLHLHPIGQKLKKGEKLAFVGDYKENGNWPPHLHFQIILDLLENQGDFPGVAYPYQKDIYESLCPDPNLFFKFNLPATKEVKDELIERRKKWLGKNLSLSYSIPHQMERGMMQYLMDEKGRRFLDTVNNVPHVGHQHPAVVDASIRQSKLLNTNTRYLHRSILEFAEKITELFPEPLKVCYFVNSGSEANELALRIATTITGKKDIVVLEQGYHGNTNACVEVSSYKFDGKGGRGKSPHIHKLHWEENLDSIDVNPAAFIHESILSCAGQVVPPANFFKDLYKIILKKGGLCIADEVQTGLGRSGDTFWAFELFGITPDIVTIGKPIGNGHPLGVVVTTREIADYFANGMEFFSTFGGNAISCEIGKTVLDVIQNENLQQNAKEIGDLLKAELWSLSSKYPIIKDVRGYGFFLGVEFEKTNQARYLVNRLSRWGILSSTDGPLNNVIKFKPPMCFSKENAEDFIFTVEKILEEEPMQSNLS